jgi:RHS repeat-associated protein
LDATGNWSGFKQFDQESATNALIQQRTHNEVNEITDIGESVGIQWTTPEHNRNGNMNLIPQPAASTTSFDALYDAWNRLTNLSDSDSDDAVAIYYYDGMNRRIKTDEYNAGVFQHTRHFFFNSQWQNLEERIDSSTDAERQYEWGIQYVDQLHYRARDTDGNGSLDEQLYSTQDANWSVVAIASQDGQILERYQYDSYGTMFLLTPYFVEQTDSSFDWEFNFTTQYRDSNTGIYLYRTRRYHSHIGCFLSRDSIDYEGSPGNLYRYANCNPINVQDPLGELPVIVGGIAVVAVAAKAYQCSCLHSEWANDFGKAPMPGEMQSCLESAGKYTIGVHCRDAIRYGTKVPNPVTLCSPLCSKRIYLGDSDIDCSTCGSFLNLVMTLIHECIHYRQVCVLSEARREWEAYKMSLEHFSSLAKSCKRFVSEGHCKSLEECKSGINKIVVEDTIWRDKYYKQLWF